MFTRDKKKDWNWSWTQENVISEKKTLNIRTCTNRMYIIISFPYSKFWLMTKKKKKKKIIAAAATATTQNDQDFFFGLWQHRNII